MTQSQKSSATNLGLVLGAILAGSTIIAYATNLRILTNWMLGVSLFISIITLGCISATKAKKIGEGYISFKDAFSTYFITVAIGVLISAVVAIVLFGFIDPEAAIQLKELTIEASVEMMRGFNAPEEAIAESIKQLENQPNQFTIKNQIQSNAVALVIHAVIGLIVALIVKKDDPNQI